MVSCLACIAEFKGTVVAVTHDRYFLDNVAGWILELDRGQGIPFEGNYSEWLKAKAKRLEVTLFTIRINNHAGRGATAMMVNLTVTKGCSYKSEGAFS